MNALDNLYFIKYFRPLILMLICLLQCTQGLPMINYITGIRFKIESHANENEIRNAII